MDDATLGLLVVGALVALVLLVGLLDLRRRRPSRQVSDADVRRGLADTHRLTGGATPEGTGGGSALL